MKMLKDLEVGEIIVHAGSLREVVELYDVSTLELYDANTLGDQESHFVAVLKTLGADDQISITSRFDFEAGPYEVRESDYKPAFKLVVGETIIFNNMPGTWAITSISPVGTPKSEVALYVVTAADNEFGSMDFALKPQDYYRAVALGKQTIEFKESESNFADLVSERRTAEHRLDLKGLRVGDEMKVVEVLDNGVVSGRYCTLTATHILDLAPLGGLGFMISFGQ